MKVIRLTLASLMLVLSAVLIAACASSTPATPAGSSNPASSDASGSTTSQTTKAAAAKAPAERNEMYQAAPPMTIDPNKKYRATIETSKGNIVVDLFPQDAPQTVNNFIYLARQGFYVGLTFHRVEPGFVIQGGDPLGVGNGGPGYTIPAEIKRSHPKGALAMARLPDQVNPQRASSGSQFYITLDATPFLDGDYTSFGQATADSMSVAEKITRGDVIKTITIQEQ